MGAAPEAAPRQRLTGNTARRKPSAIDTFVWDTELPGFGLRIRATGSKTWVLRLRRRGQQRWVLVGRVGKLSATKARSAARAMLAETATEGLPRPERSRLVPTLAEYAPGFWQDYARHWKPSTEKSYRVLLKGHLLPVFGERRLDEITRPDVMRWRDEMAGTPGTFKNTLPLLAAMLRYAEQLGFRRKGSNPCRGVPRFKRQLKERYLTPAEFRRLGAVLAEAEPVWPADLAAIRLLIFTGARVSEIASLQWGYVEVDRLRLPDSKTGPKYVYLNRQAADVLYAVPMTPGSPFVFPNGRGTGPCQHLGLRWTELRRRAAIPDVRLHDLRHSFASVAINANIALAPIGRLLGHVLPETTARYAHLMDDSIAEAAQRVCGGIARHLGLAA